MSILPIRHEYSSHEIAQARDGSPAIARYLNILDNVSQAKDAKTNLTLKRHGAWLESALATFFDRGNAESICLAWSHHADELLKEAWSLAGLNHQPAALFALGKLGSRELNLSSDVDLIIVHEEPSDEAHASLREFRRLLAEYSDVGFCFRLDFDLRPDGRLGPILTSTRQFEEYYWTRGEAWERLALVRLRGLSGAPDVLKNILELSRSFAYRRFADESFFEDLKKLRRREMPKVAGPWDLKLAAGGIRDIELFVHANQVLSGARIKSLQNPSTTAALHGLTRTQVLSKGTAEFLLESYWQYRRLENLTQIVNDTQTHTWPPVYSYPHLRLPTAEVLSSAFQKVFAITSKLFREPEATNPEDNLQDGGAWLHSLGFSQNSINSVWPEIVQVTRPLSPTGPIEQQRLMSLRNFVLELSKYPKGQDLGLGLLLDFFRSTRAQGGFFSLLNREPKLIEDIAQLFASSPYLGGVIATRPELIDSFLYRVFELTTDELDGVLAELAERRMLAEIFGSLSFLKDQQLHPLMNHLSETADAISLEILSRLHREYGQSQIELLALGKWGGQELGLRSDLDFVFITAAEPTSHDHKIARRFVTSITSAHSGGRLYDIDLRLRPSGKAGPVLVQWNKLVSYLRTEAALWERQSYLRARPITSPNSSAITPYDELINAVTARTVTAQDLQEAARIRSQVLVPSSNEGVVDLKYNPGGIVDIEFTTQIAALALRLRSVSRQTQRLVELLSAANKKWQSLGPKVLEVYDLLRKFEQAHQLALSRKGTELVLESETFDHVCHILKMDSTFARKALVENLARGQALVKDLDLIFADS